MDRGPWVVVCELRTAKAVVCGLLVVCECYNNFEPRWAVAAALNPFKRRYQTGWEKETDMEEAERYLEGVDERAVASDLLPNVEQPSLPPFGFSPMPIGF